MENWVQAEIAKELEELDLEAMEDEEQLEELSFVSKTVVEVSKQNKHIK